MGPWPIVAVVWMLWVGPPDTPCDGSRHVARQHLGGWGTGVASADVSADGRIVAFVSLARLADGDVNTIDDIYILDRTTGALRLESLAPDGRAAAGSSQQPRLSGDGRYLVFATVASNLIGWRVDTGAQVLRRDRETGTMTLVSHTPAGAPGNGWNGHPDISDDGRYVVFESRATDLVAGDDANRGGSDVYLYDATDGVVRRVSVTDSGQQSVSGQSSTPAISGTGRFVVFTSTAPIAPPSRTHAHDPVRSVFLRDLPAGLTRRISSTRGGGVPNGASYYPTISGDGRRIVFVSIATDLDGARHARQHEQLYLHDADTGRIRLLSRGTAGAGADGASHHPALSGDGRFVVFSSEASDLPCQDRCGPLADLNLVDDVYRLNLATGVADRVSGGRGAREPWWRGSGGSATDGTGRVVAFSSRQPIDEADLEDDDDLFVDVLPGGTPGALGPPPCTGPSPPPGRRR
ncbi:MAG: hypothetical protein ABIT71_08095 [Vicinamibacteraceae bacterium]